MDFDLRDVIYETVAAIALQAAVKGIELVVDIDADVPVLARGDPGAAAPDHHEPDRQRR